MPSPHAPPSQLLQSPSLVNPFFLNNALKGNYLKFPGSKLLFIPIASVSNTNPTATLHSPGLADKNLSLCTKELSHLIDKNGISLIGKQNGLPVKEEEEAEAESLDLDDGKISRLQVQCFVDAIRALPCKEILDIQNMFQKDGGMCSISDFNDLLMALVITNQDDLALKLYSNISYYGLKPDSWTFSIMVRCHCKRDDIDEAKRVLDNMLQNGFNANVATFTTLINSFCKKGKMKQAFEVFGDMSKIGCKPTVQTYNCLLKGLCYVGRVEEAFDLLADIKKEFIVPDIYTYTVLMNGFCKVGRSDEALELLHEALEMGLTPTVVTFNTLFNGFFKEGRPLEGIGVLKRMKHVNCMPDYINYSTLLHGLLIWGKVRVGLGIYKEMVANGFEVDERLMNGLLRGLCKQSWKENDLLEDAYGVFDEMKSRDHVIDQSTYGLMIQTLCMAKKVNDALVNLHQMIGLGYIPRVFTMNGVIRALCFEGKVDEAVSVLVLMYESRKFPSRISYDLIIHECNRQERSLAACIVYGAALVRGLITHTSPRR